MQAENFISPQAYTGFRQTQSTFVKAEADYIDAQARVSFDENYLGPTPRPFNPRLFDPNTSRAEILQFAQVGFPIYHDAEDAKTKRLKASMERETHLQGIAQDLVIHSWDNLNPFERRIVDVAAAGRRKVEEPQIRNAGIDLVDAFHFGHRLYESNYGTYRSLVNDKPIFSGGGMNLRILDDVSEDVFSSTTGNWVDDLGSNVFGVQRAMKMLMPHLVIPFLSRIPDKNTINKTDVDIYSRFVVGSGRARVYDSQGIVLSLQNQVLKPYSNKQRRSSLDTALSAAPEIARTLGEGIPEIQAVTIYGPLTRSPHYAMFHPNEAIQLGILFNDDSDKAQVQYAIELSQELAEAKKTAVKPGTLRGYRNMGIEERTWHFSNLAKIDQFEVDFKAAADYDTARFNLECMGEVVMQVFDGKPLYVRDAERFDQARNRLEIVKEHYFTPVFDHARALFSHMEAGYPYPLEYKANPA